MLKAQGNSYRDVFMFMSSIVLKQYRLLSSLQVVSVT